VRCGAREKGEEEERGETDAWDPHVSERNEKKRGVGWLGCMVWSACWASWAGGFA
jgi:hypothetical protein